MLGEFEKAPLLRDVQKHLGESFSKIRKVTPVKPEPLDALAPSSSVVSATMAVTPTAEGTYSAGGVAAAAATADATASSSAAGGSNNIRTNPEGQVYTVEQERAVQSILVNEQNGYYTILGVTKTADLASLKVAYRSIARNVHPNKNRAPNACKAFQLVGNAYSILSDPDQREAYDEDMRQQESQKPAATSSATSSSSSTNGTEAPRPPPDFDAYELFRTFFEEDDVETVQVDMEEPDWANQHAELERMFDEQLASQISGLPAYDMPPQLSHLKLFDYQVAGIRWLIHQERNKGIPSWFTEEGPRAWRDKITGTMFSHRPSPVKGGILADGLCLHCCNVPTACPLFTHQLCSLFLGIRHGSWEGRKAKCPSCH